MKSTSITQYFLLIYLHFLRFTGGHNHRLPIFQCTSYGNLTSTTAYQKNVETALASVSSSIGTHYGFYNASAGEIPNTVTAVALCRGDIGSESCKGCISNSILLLRQKCTNRVEALIWNTNCTLFYSNRTYSSTFEARTSAKVFSSVNASNVVDFHKALRGLAGTLRRESAGGSSLRKFATGDIGYGEDSSKIYGLMQCLPSLSSFDCNSCLSVVFRELQDCCDGDIDAGVYFSACYVRYSNVKFYNDPPAISLRSSSTPSPATPGGKHKPRIVYLIVAVALVLTGLVGIGLCFPFMKARPNNNVATKKEVALSFLLTNENQTHNGSADEMEMSSVGSLQFDLATIEAATRNFCVENKIGQGGFGPVYKGVLANEMEIAVKRLSKSSQQGSQEFINEVILMANLQHRNLVRLLGFCFDADEKLLIYEYVSNRSLDYFLFGANKHGNLDWRNRYKIIGGVARGMLYLHEDSRLRIIHRDLKASNILLDMDMNAKISDFGLARIVGLDQAQANTNKIVGTYGYMSPEYAVHGHFSVKSDVFAFGVVILEIITGKRSSGFYKPDDLEDLPHYAWKKWIEGRAMELMDPTLDEIGSKEEVMRCINIGLLCVQEDVDARPNMAHVLSLLNNYSVTPPSPTRPPHYLPKTTTTYFSSSKYVFTSANESLITEIHPR